MLKKLNSFSNTQLIMFMLYFVGLTYAFSYLFVRYHDSIGCNLNNSYNVSNQTCAIGGLLLAFVVSLITLYWITGNNKTVKRVAKRTTKKVTKPVKKAIKKIKK